MRSARFFRRGHPKKSYWHVVIVESPHKGHIASFVCETIKPIYRPYRTGNIVEYRRCGGVELLHLSGKGVIL